MGKLGYGYGSEFHLLRWMGRHRASLEKILEPVLGPAGIRWLDFRFDTRNDIPDSELKGLSFLEGNPNYEKVLNAFRSGNKSWPQQGELMNWDAVGQSGDTFILCEAKAHLEEIVRDYDPGDSPTIEQREQAFTFAKGKFGACEAADWMHSFYQLANRLYIVALLEECGVHAILLNIFFCRDKKEGWTCPQTPEEWMPTIQSELNALGINASNSFFASHVKNVFLPVDGMPEPLRSEVRNDYELPIDCIPRNTVFSIPSYQRGYRWTEKEVEALLNDLLAFAKSDSREESYCLQPLVLQEMSNRQLRVVDGQQRLTTLAIILQSLGVETHWDIMYTAEDGRQLKDLLKNSGKTINDHFRSRAMAKVGQWLAEDSSRTESLRSVLQGEGGKRVVFLRYDLPKNEAPEVDKDEGHGAFQRLNAGKTALTSSELIRALYMESGNGLDDGEKADIAKEWDLIESTMADESFWSIWNNSRFRDVPTRMDFLFSIVVDVDSEEARQDPLLLYRTFEESVSKNGVGCGNAVELRKRWEETLRCWWWMQSCHADVNIRHLIGWLSLFTAHETRVLYREQWKGLAGHRMEAFKRRLRKIVAESIGDGDIDSFRYDTCDSSTLRKVFVLLNMLEAERRGTCFRFDLYRNDFWDVEHIASQTDNPLEKKEDREEWLLLAESEMSEEEKEGLAKFTTFEKKWQEVWRLFEEAGDTISDKDAMGNLALLDSVTNRSYKNAIFPAKRRRILLELPEEVRQGRKYVPPATEAAFAKTFSPSAAQMRYWGESDAKMYRQAMKDLFDGFMNSVKEN